MFKKLITGSLKFIPWLVLAALVALRVANPDFIQVVRYKAFDLYQQTWPREDADYPVFIIDIDEKSLAEVGQWPWPRHIMADLVTKSFEEQHVSALAFDMIFAEPDRTSPENIAKSWLNLDETTEAALQHMPSHEDIFAKAFSDYPVVAGQVFLFGGDEAEEKGNLAPKVSIATLGGDIFGWVPEGSKAVRNLAKIENNTNSLGHFNILPSQDSIVRRVPMFVEYNDSIYPSLTLELLRVAQRAGSILAKVDEKSGVVAAKVGQFTIPLDGQGNVWIRYRNHSKERYISAVDILNNNVPKGLLEGGLTIVGTSAIGLFDLRSTPVFASMPGVEVHAQILETVLAQDFLHRPAWADGAELLFIIAVGCLLMVLINYFGAMLSAVAAIIATGSVVMGSIWLFKTQGYLLDVVFPTVTLIAVFMNQMFIKYAQEEASKKAIRSAFSHYLSPDLVKILSKNPEKLKLGGEQKEMSVLFSDIRGFTSISEGLTPQQLTSLLNDYLTPMTDIVQQHKGTIDKYMGDAVMAFWNAPLDIKNHAGKSCDTALHMLRELEILNKKWAKQGLPAINIGIGINTGVVNVGNMGSKQRFDYTIMGDAVNLGARLESACKAYGVRIIISENTKQQVDKAIFMPLDIVAVKGKTEPVAIYELVSMDNMPYGWKTEINTAVEAFEAYKGCKWVKAAKLYKQLKKHDVLQAMFLERIVEYKKKPPAKHWDGSYIAKTK